MKKGRIKRRMRYSLKTNRTIQSRRYLEECGDERSAKLTNGQHKPQCPKDTRLQHFCRRKVWLLCWTWPSFSFIDGSVGILLIFGRWDVAFLDLWRNQSFSFVDNWYCDLKIKMILWPEDKKQQQQQQQNRLFRAATAIENRMETDSSFQSSFWI